MFTVTRKGTLSGEAKFLLSWDTHGSEEKREKINKEIMLWMLGGKAGMGYLRRGIVLVCFLFYSSNEE